VPAKKKKKANDACAKKVKARYKVGAKNWGNKSGRKKK
jgi:hypothetical protein